MARSRAEREIEVRAPARVVLLGEHQDYLGLEVIPMAIDLDLWVRGRRIGGSQIEVVLADLGQSQTIETAGRVAPLGPRDYLSSAVALLIQSGVEVGGCTARIESDIPLARGVSSSSALCVAFVGFLLALFEPGRELDPRRVAELAYRAEVVSFGEPGGMQDHYASACGGLLHLACRPPVSVTRIDFAPTGLLLGDSGSEKATLSVLRRVKDGVQAALEGLSRQTGGAVDLSTLPADQLPVLWGGQSTVEFEMLRATLMNRDLVREGLPHLLQGIPDPVAFGHLLDLHHRWLRDGLGVSTADIERMILAAKRAGALGCKINGSGGGGAFLAYAPGREGEVLEAIAAAGGRAHRVASAPGVCAH